MIDGDVDTHLCLRHHPRAAQTSTPSPTIQTFTPRPGDSSPSDPADERGGGHQKWNQANDLANDPQQVTTQITSTPVLHKASSDLRTEEAFRRGDETSSRKRKQIQVTQRPNVG